MEPAPKNESNVGLLANVGLALTQWSMVEHQVYILFNAIADMPKLRSRSTFAAIIDFRTRLSVVDALYALEAADELEQAMWLKMSARIKKFYKKRHEIAHGMPTKEGKRWRWIPLPTPHTVAANERHGLTQQEISDRCDRFLEITEALAWFIDRADVRRGSSEPSHLQQTKEPLLISRFRELATRSPENGHK